MTRPEPLPEQAETPRWLSPQERAAWLGLAGVMLIVPSALDSRSQRETGLSTFEYLVLAMLSEAPDRTLQLKRLARLANGSLSRLSHVVTRLEKRGWVRRQQSAESARVTQALLTESGWQKVVESAPAHVDAVRDFVIDALTPEQVAQLHAITTSILARVDPDDRRVTARTLHLQTDDDCPGC